MKAKAGKGQEDEEEALERRLREAMGLPPKGLADLSDEYSSTKISLLVEGLGEVQGWILRGSPYWFKILTDNGVIYVNKGYIIAVRPLETAPGTSPQGRRAATSRSQS